MDQNLDKLENCETIFLKIERPPVQMEQTPIQKSFDIASWQTNMHLKKMFDAMWETAESMNQPLFESCKDGGV